MSAVAQIARSAAEPPAEIGRHEILLRVDDLKVHFPVHTGLLRRQSGTVKAVDGVSLTIRRGETLGLVGESGCGKTTTGRAILRLVEPTSGTISFHGEDLAKMSASKLRRLRPHIQMIFQDPQACLNPRMTVSSIIAEPLDEHFSLSGRERQERVAELMEAVGLNPDFTNRYPHEFSGGQRQRIGIARALALNPDLIVCDEPIAALDVSIQAQVMNLLADLQQKFSLTYLFISHDLSMISHFANRVAVMYLGRIVELADVEALFSAPRHPYTKALLSAVPVPDPKIEATRKRILLTGDVPSPANPPPGCNFSTRCPQAEQKCFQIEPEWRRLEDGRNVACHFAGD